MRGFGEQKIRLFAFNISASKSNINFPFAYSLRFPPFPVLQFNFSTFLRRHTKNYLYNWVRLFDVFILACKRGGFLGGTMGRESAPLVKLLWICANSRYLNSFRNSGYSVIIFGFQPDTFSVFALCTFQLGKIKSFSYGGRRACEKKPIEPNVCSMYLKKLNILKDTGSPKSLFHN